MLYHLVFPTKYRQIVINDEVDKTIKDACLEIAKRYEVHFVEIGTDKDHIHLLIQSIPTWSVTKLVTMIKSITTKYVLHHMPELKNELWGAGFWTSGYYAATIGKHGNESVITNYVKKQGTVKDYIQLHQNQLILL